MFPAQVVFRPGPAPADGLRSRKKAQTRHAIADAALDLFAEQGYEATTVDEIAAHAEVSATTFFRYFRSKSDVILSDHGERLPALQQAIIERPRSENDLEAVRRAVQQEWIAAIDPRRTMRYTQAIATSPVLRGMSLDIGRTWQAAVTDALARRRGLDLPDDSCLLAATILLAAFGTAIESWLREGSHGELATAVDHGFDLMNGLCAEWSETAPATAPRDAGR